MKKTRYATAYFQLESDYAEALKALRQAREENERKGKALEAIAEHYTDTGLAAKHMSAIARAELSGTGNSADYIWKEDRALSPGTPE